MLFDSRMKKAEAQLEKAKKLAADVTEAIAAATAERASLDVDLAAVDVGDESAFQRIQDRQRDIDDRVRLLERKLQLQADAVRSAEDEHRAAVAEERAVRERELRSQLTKAEDAAAAVAERALAEVAKLSRAVDAIALELDPLVKERRASEGLAEADAKSFRPPWRTLSAWRDLVPARGGQLSPEAVHEALKSHRAARRSQA